MRRSARRVFASCREPPALRGRKKSRKKTRPKIRPRTTSFDRWSNRDVYRHRQARTAAEHRYSQVGDLLPTPSRSVPEQRHSHQSASNSDPKCPSSSRRSSQAPRCTRSASSDEAGSSIAACTPIAIGSSSLCDVRACDRSTATARRLSRSTTGLPRALIDSWRYRVIRYKCQRRTAGDTGQAARARGRAPSTGSQAGGQ